MSLVSWRDAAVMLITALIKLDPVQCPHTQYQSLKILYLGKYKVSASLSFVIESLVSEKTSVPVSWWRDPLNAWRSQYPVWRDRDSQYTQTAR